MSKTWHRQRIVPHRFTIKMEEKKEIQQGITRSETKRGINGSVMEHKEISVYGKDLTECRIILQEEWERK